MELGSGDIVPPDDRRKRAPVIGNGDEVCGLREAEVVAVNEIGVGTRAEPGEQRMRRPGFELVPPHMRYLHHRIARLYCNDLSADPTEALDRLELAPAFRHQLHADADAEKRVGADHDRFMKCRIETRNGSEATPAIGEGADPGKNDAIGGGNCIRRAGHLDLG
jgi:hypothetical protein